jgi:hypothetical protein
MPANIDKHLEAAILNMPDKDKDKLLLKLIAKNDLLVEQMRFQLLEDESDLKYKRQEIKDYITKVALMYHDTPGWMMMAMRDLNGRISLHVKITKDKYGEVDLTIHLLKAFYDHQPDLLETFNRRSETLSEYVAKKMETLMKKIQKLNSEYYIEFYDNVNFLLQKMHTTCPAPWARQLQLPKSWEY